MLLQALNDQNQVAIDERLATEGVKGWINCRALPEQLDNPKRHSKDLESITCLAFACLVNEAHTVQKLTAAGADVAKTDSKGCSPLHYACASDIESDVKVEYLMQRDASSQESTGDSEQVVLQPELYSTSLSLAATLNQARRVKALIDDHGMSVNATDRRGRTILHLAAAAGSAEALNVLVQHPDCRVKATDEDKRTALHLAAAAGHAEAVKVLVQHPDCHVNATEKNGRSALRLAAEAGNADAVEVLVQHPSCDEDGRTVADYARDRGHDDIASLIDAKYKGHFTKHFYIRLVCSCSCCL